MLFIINEEVVLHEATMQARAKLAKALNVSPSMVLVEWKPKDNGITPEIRIELPAAPPPADLDMNDPVQRAQWEAEVAEMPSVREFLKAKGIEEPERMISLYGQLLLKDVVHRIAALKGA